MRSAISTADVKMPMKPANVIRMPAATIVFNVAGYALLTIGATFCLLPFIMLISGSFTSEHAISMYGFGVFPREMSLSAYRLLFRYPQDILRAYGVSMFTTAAGTGGGSSSPP